MSFAKQVSVVRDRRLCVRVTVCVLKPCTDTVVERVAIVGSDEMFGAWDVERAKLAHYKGSDGWVIDAL